MRSLLALLFVATLLTHFAGLAEAQSKKDSAAQPPPPPPKRQATPPEAIAVLPGFKIELLHTADPATEGSWIAMCKDNKGRLIISGQRNQPILRVSLSDGKVSSIEKLNLPISEAMGLLYAFDSLYVNGAGPQGVGLYRCWDRNGDGQFEDIKLMKSFSSTGEHGIHGLAVGPDGKLYVINGNHTDVPDGLSSQSPHRHYAEDHLLPRQWDGRGHAAGKLAPGGYILRTDPDGQEWELLLGGFRNAYDITFNADGELFTFDSDMEWDWGMPWYRPIRVNHCVSAAEFGWRSGTGKWPEYYPDSLPAVVNIGIGSPTGVCNGIGSKFPKAYQKAIYVLDWSYGRILAVHLTPDGASYTGRFENFVAPRGLVDPNHQKLPLNVTDLVIGDDGAMYFTTGGRNTQAALYRVSYIGSESTEPADLHDVEGAKERAERRKLEAFHGKEHPQAVATAWPYLSSPDRFLRYAARIALESQPPAEWAAKAVAETHPTAALTALLALARVGDRATQPQLLAALAKFPIASLPLPRQLDKLRVLSLSFIRQGPPARDAARAIAAELDGIFPASSDLLNRELSQLLIYLQHPRVLSKCLQLMAKTNLQEERMHYLFHLRTLPIGFWTLDQRKEYLSYYTKDRSQWQHPKELLQWFEMAGRPYSDGASFPNFLQNFVREFASNLSMAEKEALKAEIAAIDQAAAVTVDIKPRPFVKKWTMAELLGRLDEVNSGRNFARGKEAYAAAQCLKCHRFGNEGGSVGPDLTAIASRFDRRAMLESILEPSKVISEQYQNETFITVDGKVVTGRLVDETATSIAVQPDPLSPERVTILKTDIESRKPSPVSPMPANLIDVLHAEEILDLIAYLESAGRANHRAFRK
jgi:putative heme-binding domain-containing protein